MAQAETPRARRRMVEEAGWSTTSWISVVAGTLAAMGAVAFVAAATAAIGSALGLDTNGISTREWRQTGIVAAALATIVTFGAFYLGGYTAGRMSRRAGLRHGLLVVVTSIALIGVIAAIAWALSEHMDVTDTLKENGVPTNRSTWRDIGTGSAIAAAVAMLAGSIVGGMRGDRWHGRLATAVVEYRDAVREQEAERTRWHEALIADTPVDRTELIDLRDRDENESVEEEREQTRATTA